jgi:hypothetical protein
MPVSPYPNDAALSFINQREGANHEMYYAVVDETLSGHACDYRQRRRAFQRSLQIKLLSR